MNLFESFEALAGLVDKHRAIAYIVAMIVVCVLAWAILGIRG